MPESARPPLEGLIVADFSRVLAGPLATMMLADLGATVIKVERSGLGDDTRAWGPPWSSSSSSYFDTANHSKISLALDFANPDDLAVARDLAQRADVLVENFRPGALDAWGLGYAQSVADNPGLIYASITGFGRAGGADLMGYDFLVQAVGGLMSITGDQDGPPTKAGVALVDVLTGKDLVIGVLAALASRGITGKGCRVEVNLLSSLLSSLANQAQGYLTTGRPPGRMGNQHPSIAPYEALRCADGDLAIACGNDAQFARLTTALGVGHLASDPRFITNADRVAHRADLITELETRLVNRNASEWQAVLREVRVPAGKVGDLADAFALAQDLGLDPWTNVGDGPRKTPVVRHPVAYDSGLTADATPPPLLNEHGALLRSWLANPHSSASDLKAGLASTNSVKGS